MARSLFGGRVGDTVASLYSLGNRQVFTLPVDANGDPTTVTLTVWDAPDGTQLTDLLAADGTTAITQVVVPATGQVPEFYGPDGVNVAVYVQDPDDDFYRLDARADDAAAAAVAAQVAAEEARDAAQAVGTTNDGVIASRINDPTSATASALTASLGPKGANVARFIERARSGENLTIAALGDSILEGLTGTAPTDGAITLLATDLTARFPGTVTASNRAESGFTALRAHVNGNLAAAIADDADLYIVSAFDKNDLGADINGTYAPGYALDLSVAAIERIVRIIRAEVPKADIILMSTNPYAEGNSSNPYQEAKDAAVRRVAAVYGCEWVDTYAAFDALPAGWSSPFSASGYMADATHPGTLGHRLIADTLLDHLTDRGRGTIPPGQVPDLGLHAPQDVDTDTGSYGYVLKTSLGAATGVTYATTTNTEVQSVAGEYAEVTCTTARELHVQLSTELADAAVVDIAVDGVTVATDVALSTLGKNGTYWITVASGLDGGSHTARLTLKSGTLRTYAVSALIAAPADASFAPAVTTQAVAAAAVTTTMTTSYQSLVNAVSIPLPSGWASMDVQISGWISFRCSGATTAVRRIDLRLRNNATDIHGAMTIDVPVKAATTTLSTQTVNGLVRGATAAIPLYLQAKVDNATDTIQALQWYVNATLIRTA